MMLTKVSLAPSFSGVPRGLYDCRQRRRALLSCSPPERLPALGGTEGVDSCREMPCKEPGKEARNAWCGAQGHHTHTRARTRCLGNQRLLKKNANAATFPGEKILCQYTRPKQVSSTDSRVRCVVTARERESRRVHSFRCMCPGASSVRVPRV